MNEELYPTWNHWCSYLSMPWYEVITVRKKASECSHDEIGWPLQSSGNTNVHKTIVGRFSLIDFGALKGNDVINAFRIYMRIDSFSEMCICKSKSVLFRYTPSKECAITNHGISGWPETLARQILSASAINDLTSSELVIRWLTSHELVDDGDSIVDLPLIFMLLSYHSFFILRPNDLTMPLYLV